jgi:hypothetical protein
VAQGGRRVVERGTDERLVQRLGTHEEAAGKPQTQRLGRAGGRAGGRMASRETPEFARSERAVVQAQLVGDVVGRFPAQTIAPGFHIVGFYIVGFIK